MLNEKLEQRSEFYVQFRRVAEGTPADFRRFLRGRVASWWLPDAVEMVGDIPLWRTGKIDKKAFRAPAATATGV